ncbi:MAG: LysR family transcriptional regulator [Desulfobacteraceae bacterium]|nr:LysR family transcriptional regulator [Desulfobacteraceae bacterium]
MLPDFNRLKIFYYIFSLKSVAAAANELNITSSAVSQSLSKLEYELKIPLFTRLHKKLVPTSAGEQLFNIVEPFINDLKEGIKSIKQARQKPSGLLKIGSPIEFGKSYFPGIIARFREIYPEVIFSLKLGGPEEIFPMIGNGELDFGLVDAFLTKEQLFGDFGIYSIEPLIEEKVILACSKEYYEREINKDHSFKNLAAKEYISYQRTSLTLRNWFKYHFNKFSVKNLNRVMTVDSHQAVITGIKNNIGLGVIASHIVQKEIKKKNIIPIKMPQKDVINKISLVLLQDKIPTYTEKAFLKYFKEDILRTGTAKKYLNVY